MFSDSGQPPLQAANIKSDIDKFEVMPSMFKSSSLNKSISDIAPVDSPLSYKLIGRITILFILPAPECIILLSSTIVEPVRI